ncbi:MAG: hypothetical protein H6907_16415 [Hyphomicrobiales bacterium]|nr:hypothetical protein [Hyphomicrobiales bacterium]
MGASTPGDVAHLVHRERRLSRRAVIFWRSLRRVRGFPSMLDFRPERLPFDWNDCFVLEVDGHRQDPLFDFVGAAFDLDGGGELAGQPASRAPGDTLLQRVSGAWPACCDAGLPVQVSGGFRHRAGHAVLHRSVLLPFTREGRRLDYLVGATSHHTAAQVPENPEPEAVTAIADDDP